MSYFDPNEVFSSTLPLLEDFKPQGPTANPIFAINSSSERSLTSGELTSTISPQSNSMSNFLPQKNLSQSPFTMSNNNTLLVVDHQIKNINSFSSQGNTAALAPSFAAQKDEIAPKLSLHNISEPKKLITESALKSSSQSINDSTAEQFSTQKSHPFSQNNPTISFPTQNGSSISSFLPKNPSPDKGNAPSNFSASTPCAPQNFSLRRIAASTRDQKPSGGSYSMRKGPRSSGRKKCEYPECCITANYGVTGGSAKFCSSHRPPEMKLLYAKFCEVAECHRRAIFREEGGLLRFCREHKKDGMTTSQKLCGYSGCPTQARFGRFNEAQRWCNAHKQEGMIRLSKGLYSGDQRRNDKVGSSELSDNDVAGNGQDSQKNVDSKRMRFLSPSNNLPVPLVESLSKQIVPAFSMVATQPILVSGCPLEHIAGKFKRLADLGYISKEHCDKEIALAMKEYREKITGAFSASRSV